MKRLNNRGFAISTVLYGVVIMVLLIVTLLISIMSSTRSTSKRFISQLDDELMALADSRKEFAVGDSWQAPIKGYYRVEMYDKNNNKYRYGYFNINKGVTISYTASNTISGISTWNTSNYEEFSTSSLSSNKLIIEYLSDKIVRKTDITKLPNIRTKAIGTSSNPKTIANITTGNYYIVVKGATGGNTKTLQMDSEGNNLIVADFDPEQTWNITYVKDYYSGREGSDEATDFVEGYKIINNKTGKTFESIAQEPIPTSGIRVANYTKLDVTKKWILNYENSASPTNTYVMSNSAASLILKYLPTKTENPFEFQNKPGGSIPEEYKFTLYKKI